MSDVLLIVWAEFDSPQIAAEVRRRLEALPPLAKGSLARSLENLDQAESLESDDPLFVGAELDPSGGDGADAYAMSQLQALRECGAVRSAAWLDGYQDFAEANVFIQSDSKLTKYNLDFTEQELATIRSGGLLKVLDHRGDTLKAHTVRQDSRLNKLMSGLDERWATYKQDPDLAPTVAAIEKASARAALEMQPSPSQWQRPESEWASHRADFLSFNRSGLSVLSRSALEQLKQYFLTGSDTKKGTIRGQSTRDLPLLFRLWLAPTLTVTSARAEVRRSELASDVEFSAALLKQYVAPNPPPTVDERAPALYKALLPERAVCLKYKNPFRLHGTESEFIEVELQDRHTRKQLWQQLAAWLEMESPGKNPLCRFRLDTLLSSTNHDLRGSTLGRAAQREAFVATLTTAARTGPRGARKSVASAMLSRLLAGEGPEQLITAAKRSDVSRRGTAKREGKATTESPTRKSVGRKSTKRRRPRSKK